MRQMWVRSTRLHPDALNQFWTLTEADYLTHVLAYLEERFQEDSNRAQFIQHNYAAFGAQDTPEWAELMGLQGTEYDPKRSTDSIERFRREMAEAPDTIAIE